MKPWFITGCSSGFGRRLALAAAQRGDRVVATARDVTSIDAMAAPFAGRMIALPLDVTDAAAARSAVAKAVETFGGFDVLVHNAGYGLYGAIEEGVSGPVRRPGPSAAGRLPRTRVRSRPMRGSHPTCPSSGRCPGSTPW